MSYYAINGLIFSISGNTAGASSSIAYGDIVLQGGANITLSQTSNTIVIIGGAGGAGGGIAASAAGSSVSSGTVVWSNSNNVSFGMNGSTITASASFAGGAVTGISGIQVSDTTYTSGTVTFRNANGISFGSSGAQGISASHNGLTSQSNQAFSANGGSSAFQTLNFGDTNQVSWTNTNGSVGIASIKLSMFAVSNTTQSTVGTAQHTALSFNGAGAVSVGISGGSVVISAPNTIAQSNQQMTLFATSNTTQSTSMTVNASSLIFAGAGIASVGVSNGSVIVSVPSGGGAGDGGVFAGVSTMGNTAGSTGTVSTGNFVLVGSGPISLSQSTGAAGSAATVTINGPATSSLVGANGIQVTTNGSTITVRPNYQSYFANVDQLAGTQTMTMLQSTSGMFPFFLEHPLSVSFVRMALSGSVLAASTTAATTGGTQFSGGHSRSHNFVLYSRGTGASSNSLLSVTSTQITEQFSFNVSAAANSTQFSYTMRYTLPHSTGSVGFTKDYSSSAASLNFHTSHVTDLTGNKMVDFPFAISITPGQYWLGYGISSSTASQFTNNVTRGGVAFTQYGVSQINAGFGTLGAATNNSVNIQPGIGSFSVAGGSTTANVDLSQLSSSVSQNILYIQLMRVA